MKLAYTHEGDVNQNANEKTSTKSLLYKSNRKKKTWPKKKGHSKA